MKGKQSMTEVKSVADRVVDVYGRISEMLGTDESIRSRLKANSTIRLSQILSMPRLRQWRSEQQQ